jgi:hypothetical protein
MLSVDAIGESDYFIVCHDQEIINEQRSSNYQWLFVGNGNTDNLENRSVTVCRNLEKNIEQYPYLCSFTAWYAVAKNNLPKSDNITLIEYDTTIQSNNPFHYKLNNNNQVICYSVTLFNHYVFYKSTPWLEISLKQIYDIDLYQFIRDNRNQYKFWPTTTNMTLSKDILNRFVDWFLPMTEIFRHDPLGAYVHERAFFVFCVMNKIEFQYSANALNHKQKASHKIIDFYGSFLASKNSIELKKSMILEYDKLYNELFINCLEKTSSR